MKKIITYILCFVFTLFLSTSTFGQVVEHNTKIKDGSVSNTAVTPSSNAVLELESNSKGFLLPRMSNTQRDAIPVNQREEGNGLTIYNTDTNCLNYWNKSAAIWMSLCGTLPPAVITINPATACGKIVLRTVDKTDKLKQGKYLTPDDILYVDVNVSTVGTYDISAVTDNGYYFSATGSFMNTGVMRVALKGAGVPINGYTGANTGDTVKFYVNGKDLGNICPNYKIPVDKDGTQFSVNCGSIGTVMGNYFIGVPVDPLKNYVDISVNVTAKGNYKVSTSVSNGVSFSGSGTFDNIGNNQTVRLYAEGVPTTAGTFQVSTKTNSNDGAQTPCNISFTIKGVDYKVDLTKSTHRGEYLHGKKLQNTNTMTIEVEVLAPGKASFEVKSGDIIFRTNNVVLNYIDGQVNKQLVILTNNGSLLPSSGDKLTFLGTGKYTGSYSIDLKSPLVDYILDCSSLKVGMEDVYTPGVPVGAKHSVTVKVDVINPGAYTITTTSSNGITFEATGVFTQKETQKEITLLAKGTPVIAKDNIQFVLKTNSLSDAKNKCTFNIDVKFPTRTFNIMVVGDEEYGPSYPSGAAYRLLNNPDNFGPNGKVRTNGISVTHYPKKNIAIETDGYALGYALVEQNIDILLFVQGTTVTTNGSNFVEKFINSGGVIIVNTQDKEYIMDVMNNVLEPSYHQSFFLRTGSGSITFKEDFGNKQSQFGSIKDKKAINFVSKYLYADEFSDKYYEFLVLAPRNPKYPVVFKHRKKGFMYIGLGGWMASTRGRSTIGPLKATMDGQPETNSYSGEQVDNAQFFLKVMEWAIQYSLDNKKK